MTASGSSADMSLGAARSQPPRCVVVTGLSGAGRTSALKHLEDIGYEAVDNMPLSLLRGLTPDADAARPLAIGVDIRTRSFTAEAAVESLDQLARVMGGPVRLLFVDADDEVLARRFTETRRRHPLAVDRPLMDGIRLERELIAPLRERADLVIDTSRLAPADLRRALDGYFRQDVSPGLLVFVTSFSYRLGLPREADLVFDARFLRNPHYVPALRPKSGRDQDVADYIAQDEGLAPFLGGLTGLIAPLLPRFAQEGKSYLTIAVGCTGGRHRSVFIAERLAAWLKENGQKVELRHRDLTTPDSKDLGKAQ